MPQTEIKLGTSTTTAEPDEVNEDVKEREPQSIFTSTTEAPENINERELPACDKQVCESALVIKGARGRRPRAKLDAQVEG